MTENLSIDGHVHFFTASDLAAVEGQLPYLLPSPHSLSDYLADLASAGIFPKLLNNVHLSILPDSSNVFASFDELAALKAKWPERYGDVRLVGTIKADPAYATVERLSHPDVFGIRIVLHDAPPESISDRAYRSDDWVALIGRLRVQQHVHIYAKEAETNLRVLRQMPETIRVVIDHLGSCHAERGADEPSYHALLEEAKRRGNVWFKGPGYRTSTISMMSFLSCRQSSRPSERTAFCSRPATLRTLGRAAKATVLQATSILCRRSNSRRRSLRR
ncbi:amidohydrolase family protein (plasmid) [Rhizobium sp. CB3060]|uniref:amidohydrolase family protein n=1 Tax=Rhizobium sp. CB3060 TaxID=3138255 RepID=UPI0021A43BF5|nr:amidohydrolase family protein [Rhizobium tropici]UWU23872.1 amidohydrolase family protein [Rhizobium tropici]